MKTRKFFASLCILIFLSTPVSAEKSELTIYLEVLYFNASMTTVDCDRLLFIPAEKDLSDFSDMPCYLQDTRMTATLTGPPGSTITFFGMQAYAEEKGYIVIRKTDAQKVWVRDLIDFPDSEWVTVEADSSSGGYEAFYKAGPAFDSNVKSLKWGQWWTKLP